MSSPQLRIFMEFTLMIRLFKIFNNYIRRVRMGYELIAHEAEKVKSN